MDTDIHGFLVKEASQLADGGTAGLRNTHCVTYPISVHLCVSVV